MGERSSVLFEATNWVRPFKWKFSKNSMRFKKKIISLVTQGTFPVPTHRKRLVATILDKEDERPLHHRRQF